MQKVSQTLTRSELVALVAKISDPAVPDPEMELLCATLEANVPHPSPLDLIFHPRDGQELTVQEIVDAALGYKPVVATEI